MLLAARRLRIPLIIGSASDTGTDRGVVQYVRLVREIATEHRLAPFRLAAIYSEIPVDEIRRRLKDGATIRGLNGRPDCDAAALDRTDCIVAVMGAEPIRDVLEAGADVVIAGRSSDCALFIVGIRDPYTIANLDRAIGWAKGKLTERFGPIGQGYNVFYHVYGRNAVMGAMEPTPARAPLEVGIVVEVICDDAARAETICHIAGKNLFYARLPEVKGTAGTAAIMSDEVLHARPAYEWTLNHVIEVADPRELFRTRFETIRGGDPETRR
jgi:hypothetical protein